jgi:hypothetical protein
MQKKKENIILKWLYILSYNFVLLLTKIKPRRKYKKIQSNI